MTGGQEVASSSLVTPTW